MRIEQESLTLADDQAMDFVIATALPEERDEILRKLPGYQQCRPGIEDNRIYYRADVPFIFPDQSRGIYRIVVTCLSNMGRLSAGLAVQDAIRVWHPRYILLVGIAAGIADNNIKLGDILIANKVIDYEKQKVRSRATEFRWEPYSVDSRLINASNAFSDAGWLDLVETARPEPGYPARHIGPIASGDKVIAFARFWTRLRKSWPKLIGAEMEAGGAALAALESVYKPGFFMVRGVSDYGDERKGENGVEKWRKYACDVAASFTIGFLKSGPVPIDGRRIIPGPVVPDVINEGQAGQPTPGKPIVQEVSSDPPTVEKTLNSEDQGANEPGAVSVLLYPKSYNEFNLKEFFEATEKVAETEGVNTEDVRIKCIRPGQGGTEVYYSLHSTPLSKPFSPGPHKLQQPISKEMASSGTQTPTILTPESSGGGISAYQPAAYYFLDGLDSTRFKKERIAGDWPSKKGLLDISLLDIDCDIVTALLFGYGIIFSENQIYDSIGTLTRVAELIHIADQANLLLPFRFTYIYDERNSGWLQKIAFHFGNVGNIDPSRDTYLSSWWDLQSSGDIGRRKYWQEQILKGAPGITKLIDSTKSTQEKEYLWGLRTIVEYIQKWEARGKTLIHGIASRADLLENEYKDIVSLSERKNLETLASPFSEKANWMLSDQNGSCQQIISVLREFQFTKEIIKRSYFHNRLKEEDPVQRAALIVMDQIYNHATAVSMNAPSTSATFLSDSSILVKSAQHLALWARYNQFSGEHYEVDTSLSEPAGLHFVSSPSKELLKQILEHKDHFIQYLGMYREPDWLISLHAYWKARENYRDVRRKNDVSLLEKSHQQLNGLRENHLLLSSKYISGIFKPSSNGLENDQFIYRIGKLIGPAESVRQRADQMNESETFYRILYSIVDNTRIG